MKLIETIQEMRAWSSQARQAGKTIAFVPTMGALHEGHLSLVRLAREKADCVVVSIFINPLQFGPREDFTHYPRTIERDVVLLKTEHVDAVFVPSVKQMYSSECPTTVQACGLAKKLCGIMRPEHFNGVVTAVSTLFNIVSPHIALFGDKDFQQRRIIERLVKDLNSDVEIIGAPIMRETDGLAMSSRNLYLDTADRQRALVLSRSLRAAEKLFYAGERQAHRILQIVSEMIDKESPTNVDYISLCDTERLEDVSLIEQPTLLALAVTFGRTPLIDNTVLDPTYETY